MNARRRDRVRKPARREPFREQKPMILIVCEGEVTEKEYLKGIEKKYHNSRVTIEIAPESGRDPLSLVKVARDRKKDVELKAQKQGDDNLAYDQVWCLHDIDDHPVDKIAGAKDMARDNGIHLAVSNPCIELWLYLHFEDTGQIHRKKLSTMLKKRIPQYDKHVHFADYETGIADAIQRAKALDKLAKIANDPDRNPTTAVYRLVEEIQRG